MTIKTSMALPQTCLPVTVDTVLLFTGHSPAARARPPLHVAIAGERATAAPPPTRPAAYSPEGTAATSRAAVAPAVVCSGGGAERCFRRPPAVCQPSLESITQLDKHGEQAGRVMAASSLEHRKA